MTGTRSQKLWVLGAISVMSLAVVSPVRNSYAARFSNLYRVTVETDPDTGDQRAAALELAMSKMLVRVTGRREAAVDPQLEPLLEDPDRYVALFGSNLQGRTVVGFNSSLVNQALTSLSWPIWGRERPLTLLWIAVDDGRGERAVISADGPQSDANPTMAMLLNGIRQKVLAVAEERGLPIAFPLLDLEDRTAVSFVDVWGGFEDRIFSASTRYSPDVVLLGRLRPTQFGNEVTWLLLKDGSRRAIAGTSVRDGLDTVADLYAAEFSSIGDLTSTQITVLNVETVDDYGRVMRYLEGMSVVRTVDVESLEGGVLKLRARARGDRRVFERVLALGDVLSPERQTSSGAAPSESLVFRVGGQSTR